MGNETISWDEDMIPDWVRDWDRGAIRPTGGWGFASNAAIAKKEKGEGKMTKDRLTTELGRISQLCAGSGFDLEATLWLMGAMLKAIADFEEGKEESE